MSKKRTLNVDDAYALATPADSIHLYGKWAESYDQDFADAVSYIVYRHASEALLQFRSEIDGVVLDVGCGTGLVGVCLHEGGIGSIDGIDISQPMLDEAAKKETSSGRPVYRKLIAADLTKQLQIPDNEYAGLISAGTFTHGHLGVGPLDELWRIAAPGACCAIGVRTTHFEQAGFVEKLSVDVAHGKITQPELLEVNMYSTGTSNTEHANDKAFIVVCKVK